MTALTKLHGQLLDADTHEMVPAQMVKTKSANGNRRLTKSAPVGCRLLWGQAYLHSDATSAKTSAALLNAELPQALGRRRSELRYTLECEKRRHGMSCPYEEWTLVGHYQMD